MSKKLFQAIAKNDPKLIQAILRGSHLSKNKMRKRNVSNFDINAQDKKSGNTALHLAIIFDNMQAVDLLLDYGADLHIKNNKGLDAFSLYEKVHYY